jgi:signal transduction histidine kinase
VPIRTRRGINIGVFCVMDSTPGKAWRDADTVRLHDISQTIMGHLETQRLKELHRKSERMNRGMASFIEGKPAIYDKCESGGDTNAILEKVEEEVTEAAHPDGSHSKVGSSKDIFSKAAKIICQSAEVESCFFFDATMESYRVPSLPRINPLFASSRASATSSSDESLDADQLQVFPCSQVLGCSLSEDADLDRTTYRRPDSLIPEQFLGKLLQRYPHGKIFNFGADGELQSSDSSEDEITHAAASPGLTESFPRINLADGSTAPMKPPSKPWSRKNEGNIILQAFPTARSVAFVPIWDPKKERWFAGGFICTENPSRALTISNDMSYLRAFGTLAMVEVLRLQTSQADKAKSDVLGSMSHELRSPLHGILLSADLLLDTNLDVFQGNAAHTIETCSRTLLDTIDHLLDFSKVNHFATRKSRANQVDKPVTGVDWRNFGKKSLFSNCRLDSLVEEVVESVFAGFTYQHSPERRMRSGSPVPTGGDTLHVDTLSATDGELQFKFADVSVFLSIDPRRDWMYCVQVGAFRRIIMNILGNALKYTRQGSVKISLTQEHVVHNRLKPDRVIRFTVQDTGKGIGPEFLKHGLYRPFSQEDTFAPGTGLGLSLVKRITSQLAGHIAVESQVGVGTTVTVDLPLEPVPKASAAEFLSEDDREFDELLQDLRGLRVKIMSYSGIADGGSLDDHRKQIEAICTQWLHMEVITDKNAEIQPDMIVWTHEALPKVAEDIKLLAAAPNIVVCSNSLEAYRQSQSFESDGHFGIFEFISQP